MHIPEAIDDGIENLKREGSSATANYYFIIDGNRSSTTFSYYDSMQKKFVEKTILLEYFKNKIESGDLNPKDLSFDKFKKYSLISLALFFLIMLFSTRDRFYIFALLITITILVYIYLPKKIICIDEGTPLYILPTKNSNISLRIDDKIDREVLKEYRKYYKIDYKNGITGWIKDEDLCKD
jgi:hypothetical protein